MSRSATRNRVGKNPTYLAWIRTLPCVVCLMVVAKSSWHEIHAFMFQRTATEAAHVGERGLSQKCPDRETLPLCRWHHTEGPESHHRLGKRFWTVWGLDRDALIAELNGRFKSECLQSST